MPLPDQITLELEAIDAALTGDRVDPEFAELAELALMLADTRPSLPVDAGTRLDQRVSALASDPKPVRRPWILRPAFGAGLAGVAAVALVIVLVSGGGGSSGSYNGPAGVAAQTSAAAAGTPTVLGGAAHGSGAAGSIAAPASSKPTLNQLGASVGATPTTPYAPAQVQPTPSANGQKIIQSSQLSLTAPSGRIDQVSQELFDVVGTEQGIVKHSSVTAGNGGFASFTLSIPTSNLSATLARLSSLKYSRVSSSTETTSDVTDTYQDEQRALTDEKAFHRSLVTQLADATTSEDADGLRTKITAVELEIARQEKALNSLQSRVSYTSVSVQINAGNITVAHRKKPKASSGFTLHTAGHDALRVLVVAAGVALIALAVLVPLTLVLALIAWLGFGWRRRLRESALDAA